MVAATGVHAGKSGVLCARIDIIARHCPADVETAQTKDADTEEEKNEAGH